MRIPWICGYITYLGYLYCHKCFRDRDVRDNYDTIYSDSFPHNEEKCERCKRVVKEVEK